MPSNADTGSAALAAVIAHELNNIAVPLRGFIDLALDKTARDDAVLQCIDEVRIGMDRITALAFELASLAQDASSPASVPLESCLESTDFREAMQRPPVTWSCDPKLTVAVDLNQARRAVVSLASLASEAGLFIEKVPAEGALAGNPSCAVCAKPFPRRKAWVQIRAPGLRATVLEAVRSPFDAGHKVRGVERLTIAALQHSSHRAGGHVMVDLSAGDLSLLLPQAASTPSSSRSGPR